jgi:hypothetical protein
MKLRNDNAKARCRSISAYRDRIIMDRIREKPYCPDETPYDPLRS